MIELLQLRKEFDELVAVDDLEVTIPAGEIYGLIGPNGAGKTTTIRMACGLLTPTAGRVRVNGVDVHDEPERAQQFIGYLSDFFSVYEDLKVWEYLDYFAHAYKMREAEIPGRIDQVIQQVGLEVKRDAMIQGLSRGMKQRLGIARAIIHLPKVLLLDEPASGLDPKARLDLRNLLRALRDQGTTILISSHILTELEGFCTSIGLMEKGRMVRSGTLEEITAEESKYRVVRLAWTGDSAAQVEARLKALPGVSNLMVEGGEGVFRFAGPEDGLAAVLRELVAAGIPLVSFGEVKQTVEDLYLKLSRNEVM
ncbi:MAG TPA: ABC transporter ATP-binding protein [Terriglobales bacterium]|nr:ABC transporter ATP-binding protein [Terriglobales bacterium]